jgi:hypothetical protein
MNQDNCICPEECDCECPEPESGVALCSNSCPVHNVNPSIVQGCPVHDPDDGWSE